MDPIIILVCAVIAFLGQTLSVVIASYLGRKDTQKLTAIAHVTHSIVNSQRTVMLRLVAQFASRIAADNPSDEQAQATAKTTKQEADEADAAAELAEKGLGEGGNGKATE